MIRKIKNELSGLTVSCRERLEAKKELDDLAYDFLVRESYCIRDASESPRGNP